LLCVQPRNWLLHILKVNIGVHISCPTTVFAGNKKAPALRFSEEKGNEQGHCPNDSIIIDPFVSDVKKKTKEVKIMKKCPCS